MRRWDDGGAGTVVALAVMLALMAAVLAIAVAASLTLRHAQAQAAADAAALAAARAARGWEARAIVWTQAEACAIGDTAARAAGGAMVSCEVDPDGTVEVIVEDGAVPATARAGRRAHR